MSHLAQAHRRGAVHIKSDLERVDATKDEEIDYSDIPQFDSDFLRNVPMKTSPGKK